MRRLVLIVIAVAAGAAIFATSGVTQDGSDADRYTVVLNNAFGLIEGADVKVEGVRAGKIESFEIDPKTYKALVEISIGKEGFGDLRKDAFCESRPQSLIGEYFIDCKAGKAKERLADGARITDTGSTIPVDLVNNIMRRPYRERFSILLGELGVALGARGEDLNDAIRRANPALRQTNEVLEVLAEEREVIADLTSNARVVVEALADNKEDVTRFIREARDTSQASAARYDDLRGQFQRFPTFLAELRPTMQLLGEAADRQAPAMRNLAEAAPLLRRFFDILGPFSEASRPSFRSLAKAADAGRDAVKSTRPRLKELQAFAGPLDELVTNLAMTLEHLDDRKFAVEKDPRSPGGEGFTGYEAFLQYIFRQSQATNVYDENTYYLKVSAFLDNVCAQYADAAQARLPEKQRCRAILGPTQLGIDQPDPTATGGTSKARKRGKRGGKDGEEKAEEPGGDERAPETREPERTPDTSTPPQTTLPPQVQKLLDDLVPNNPLSGKDKPEQPTGPLLDFLFGS